MRCGENRIHLILMLLLTIALYGCSSLPGPDPREILKHPLGTSSLRNGMSKEEILELWGEPDSIDNLGSDELGLSKELWTYKARYPNAPVSLGYASRDQRLFFQGNALINTQSQE